MTLRALPNAAPSAPLFTSHRAWADAVNSRFLPLELAPRRREGFAAHIRILDHGDTQLAMVGTQAHSVRRTRALAERSEHGHFKMFWLLDGGCEVEQGDNRSLLRPGDWTIYDTARPYAMELGDDTRFLVLLLPHAACDTWGLEWGMIAEQLCGRALRMDTCARGALFALMSLFETADEGLRTGAPPVIQAAGGMLAASLLNQARSDNLDSRSSRRLAEARQYVLAHLGDARLTPECLAQALGVSRRALYLLFSDAGTTPASFILSTRLERCRDALASPANRHRTITEIALDHGFCDSAHFSRLFKARFATTPGQWREHHA